MSDDQPYLTPEEVVTRWKKAVSEKTLANWRGNGTGPKFTKIGTSVRYALSDLLEWEAKQQRVTSRTPVEGEPPLPPEPPAE